jgi:flagellar biosynthesis/type III secretory pathway M-ring protein FliF/YscJ
MNNFIPKFERLQRALADLSPARRWLAGTLLAVMIATGVWVIGRSGVPWSRNSANGVTGVMEPVLDQAFADADLARIVKYLDLKGIDHQVIDGKVFVAASQRLDVLSDLFYAGILGGGGGTKSSGFDALVKQMNPLDLPSKTEKMFNRYLEQTVEEVIARHPGVRKTTVVIDPTNERRLGGESILPTAMVDIQTRGEGSANPRQISQGAVNVLTGVIANLSADRVRVTIDGASFNARPDALIAGSGSSADLLERKQKSEQLHVAKVRQLLSYIPGDVLVSVSVDLDVPVAAGAAAVGEEADGAKPQADGAVVANAVPMVPDATKASAPLRAESVRSASVAVPRTYFVKIYRRANSGTQEPTDALLQPVVNAYSLKIRNLVKNALGVEDDDAVTIETYDDALPAAANEAVTASAVIEPKGAVSAGSVSPRLAVITRNLNTYAREVALVTLAAVVATALSLIVRRRGPGARQAVVVDPHGRQQVAREHSLVNGTLHDVMDDDDDDAQNHGGDPHQLFRRVRDMAQERPEDAARVLRSWIYQQD